MPGFFEKGEMKKNIYCFLSLVFVVGVQVFFGNNCYAMDDAVVAAENTWVIPALSSNNQKAKVPLTPEERRALLMKLSKNKSISKAANSNPKNSLSGKALLGDILNETPVKAPEKVVMPEETVASPSETAAKHLKDNNNGNNFAAQAGIPVSSLSKDKPSVPAAKLITKSKKYVPSSPKKLVSLNKTRTSKFVILKNEPMDLGSTHLMAWSNINEEIEFYKHYLFWQKFFNFSIFLFFTSGALLFGKKIFHKLLKIKFIPVFKCFK